MFEESAEILKRRTPAVWLMYLGLPEGIPELNNERSFNIMIRLCEYRDKEVIYQIINDAAQAYEGVIPYDLYHAPYMTMEELNHEMNEGVMFWGLEENNELLGVMGIQDKGEVSLIRHAYVKTSQRKGGIDLQASVSFN